jgi:serine/threonine protein kinase
VRLGNGDLAREQVAEARPARGAGCILGRRRLRLALGAPAALVRRFGLYYKLVVTALPPGSVFAGYRIEELAGRGGMGVVYRAVDVDLERTVALKLISTELSDDPAFRRRFQAESRIAASLEHPNVVTLFHAGEQDGSLYLAMRYVEGDDLRDAIAECGRMPPDRAVRIVGQIAAALDAAHAEGLVHRDVKPANILLGPGDHAYLTDFGLTKRLFADSEETVTENLLGTLDYVAPEQIRGQEVGPWTDVYALGCVLFHALTGRPPFASLEREAKLWAHVSEPPGSLGPGIPQGLDGVVSRAMAKDPGERFETAGDLAGAAAAPLGAGESWGLAAAADLVSFAPAATGPIAPSSRRDYDRTSIARALLSPFSLALLGGTLLVGVASGTLPIAVPLALFLYLAAAAVVARDRGLQRKSVGGRDPVPLTSAEGPPPRIAALLEQAAEKRTRIEEAIERAELPYAELGEEVERLVVTIGQTAARAELLDEGLRDAPPERIASRLRQLEAERNAPGREELSEALRAQLAVQRRLEQQLERFFGQMEQILVELDTIRGQLVSLSASTDASNQRRLAARAQSLREEAGAVAEGMESAYAEHPVPTDVERK